MKRRLFSKLGMVALLACVAVGIFSCDKDDDPKPAEASSLTLVSGGEQTAIVGAALASPIVVKVKDQNGEPFAGAKLNFSVAEGSVSAASAVTSAEGTASVTWTMGDTEGEQTLQISGVGTPLTVKATAAPRPNPEITSFTPETGKIGDEITITGAHFGTNTEKVTVTVNGKEQEIVSVSDDQIKIKLVGKTFTGAVKVAVEGLQEVTAANELVYTDSYRLEKINDMATYQLRVDSKGDIYALEELGFGYYNVVKIKKGDTEGETIVEDIEGTYYSNITFDKDDQLYVFDAEGAEVMKYNGINDLELIVDLPDEWSRTPGFMTFDAKGVMYVSVIRGNKVYKVEDGKAQPFASYDGFIGSLFYDNEESVFYFRDNFDIKVLTLNGKVKHYANYGNKFDGLGFTFDKSRKLIMVHEGNILRENDDKTFSEWLPSVLGGIDFFCLCVAPNGDVYLGGIDTPGLYKLIIE